jgi:sulfur carrier protein
MNITLNGQPFELNSGATLNDVIRLLELEGKRYAIEVNEQIIPRSEHGIYALNTGDDVEIVQAIGGG